MTTRGLGPVELSGRERELATIDAALSGLPVAGRSLLLVGAPGIGKSALLRAASERAERRGARLLSAAGVQAEAALPFAMLHQLLHPLSARIDELEPLQRDVLRTAFGRAEGRPPDLFLVAIAALDLLTDAATDVPIVAVVDDLHWADAASRQVLSFVARRLEADPVVFIAATRDGDDSAQLQAAIPAIEIPPVDDDAAEQILRWHHPRLDDRARTEVRRDAAGNPLALVELPLAMHNGRPRPPGRPSTLTKRLEHSFAARLADLDGLSRAAVIVAAVNDSDSLTETVRATGLLATGTARSTAETLTPAVRSRLVEVTDTSVTFRHPLVRSAICQAAGADERRAAHRALAEVITAHPERRAWHSAAAVSGQDERIAAELEAAARSAERRGDPSLGAVAWERAAALTPDPDRRGSRLVRAAELCLQLGRTSYAAALLDREDLEARAVGDRARIALIRESVDPGVPGDPIRVRSLADLARDVFASGDVDLAAAVLLAGAVRVWSADPGTDARRHLIAMVDQLPLVRDDPRRLSILGFADPGAHGDLIIDRVSRLRPEELDEHSAQLAMSVYLVGANSAVAALQAAVVQGVRARGQLGVLPRVLTQQAWNAIAMLDWHVAVPAADEAARLADETGQAIWQAAAMTGQAMIAGLRGDSATADLLSADAERIVLPLRLNAVLCGIQFTRGVTALGAGRYDDAFAHLRRTLEPSDPSYQAVQSTWVLGELAEAAAHTDRVDDARELVDSVRPEAGVTPSPWTRVALQYARPLLAPDRSADDRFREALAGDLARWPSYRARLLLEYGTWLRRRRRVADSRGPLRDARDACDALGLAPWAERARQELRATGEASSKPQVEAWAALSPQELQIAQLAAVGLSNREIGQRLYLSHRTVGSHLYRMFPKLGITSRAQLGAALGNTAQPMNA